MHHAGMCKWHAWLGQSEKHIILQWSNRFQLSAIIDRVMGVNCWTNEDAVITAMEESQKHPTHLLLHSKALPH